MVIFAPLIIPFRICHSSQGDHSVLCPSLVNNGSFREMRWKSNVDGERRDPDGGLH